MRFMGLGLFVVSVACTQSTEPTGSVVSLQKVSKTALECFDDSSCGEGRYCCDLVCQYEACGGDPDPAPTCSATWEPCSSDADCCDDFTCQFVDGIDVCLR